MAYSEEDFEFLKMSGALNEVDRFGRPLCGVNTAPKVHVPRGTIIEHNGTVVRVAMWRTGEYVHGSSECFVNGMK